MNGPLKTRPRGEASQQLLALLAERADADGVVKIRGRDVSVLMGLSQAGGCSALNRLLDRGYVTAVGLGYGFVRLTGKPYDPNPRRPTEHRKVSYPINRKPPRVASSEESGADEGDDEAQVTLGEPIPGMKPMCGEIGIEAVTWRIANRAATGSGEPRFVKISLPRVRWLEGLAR